MVNNRGKEASVLLIQKEHYVFILSFNDKMKGLQCVNSLSSVRLPAMHSNYCSTQCLSEEAVSQMQKHPTCTHYPGGGGFFNVAW